MRISKEPEIRKQEIIDSAMKVFASKGYETATMKDIAAEANIVPGLCYHYFRNKHKLYLEAISQYAKESSSVFIIVFQKTDQSLAECLNSLEERSLNQQQFKYKDFFDKKGNELFHKELDLYMSKEILPHIEEYMKVLMERGEIKSQNVHLLSRFLWEGLLAVMNEDSTSIEERIGFIREMIIKTTE